MRKYLSVLFFTTVLSGLAYIDDAAAQVEAIKGKCARIEKENAIISQIEAPANAKNWQEMENISKQLIAMDPDRWEYQTLAKAQYYMGKQQETLDAYEKATGMAEKSAGKDFKAGTAKIKAARCSREKVTST